MLLNDINLRDFFNEMFSNLNGLVKKPHEVLRHEFATMGCKAAVKAGYRLSEKEKLSPGRFLFIGLEATFVYVCG